MSKQSEYWAKRFAQLEESQHTSSEAKAAEIERQFKEAERTIQSQISEWYVRFADENGEISITKAKKLLNSKELEELRWDVNEYIKHGEENALNQKWMHELENASAKVHINRLEALKLRIQAEGEKLYGSVEDGVKKHIKKQYKDSYYHTAYEIAKGSGVGVNFAAVNEKKLEALINKPWAADGKNFAVRLGESKAQLIDNVYKSLVQMTLTGENPDKAISMLSKTMDGDKKRAARIIMTESAYFTELANKESYKELGVEQYEIIATLDSHTSEICQEMDGKVFDLKDMEPGVTAPPFHPNCRSCTAPYYDDSEFEDDEDLKSFVGERAARDEEGKYYTVPADTTYRDWYKGFVGEKAAPEKAGFMPMNLQFFSKGIPETNTTPRPENPSYDYVDITERYFEEAKPHPYSERIIDSFIQDGVKYKVGEPGVSLKISEREKEIAKLWEETFGGEVQLMPTVSGLKYKNQKVKTPDYLINGLRYDLKTLESNNAEAIYNATHKKRRQADNYIIDISLGTISEEEAIRQMIEIFKNKHTNFIREIVLVKNDQFLKVMRRK